MATTERMTDVDPDDIHRRCDAATDGPWRAYVEGRDHTAGSSFIHTTSGDGFELSGATEADYDFVARVAGAERPDSAV